MILVQGVCVFRFPDTAFRRQQLDTAQVVMRRAYLGFADRMRSRAFALAEAVASRVNLLSKATTLEALDRLAASVRRICERQPSRVAWCPE